MDELLAGFAFTLLVLGFVFACNVDGEHAVKVSGGTNNQVIIDESFCDVETYPDAKERRACKDALLKAMACEDKKK